MILRVLLAGLLLGLPLAVQAQRPQPEPGQSEHKAVVENADKPVLSKADRAAAEAGSVASTAIVPPSSAEDAKPPTDAAYVRPDREKRFKNYLNDLAGPLALVKYTATAGLLTLRNSPKEWGYKPDGFGRRLANVAAKGAIRSTTIYGLDELLKVDSRFYRSRDRRVMARMRNAVFSAVTARNRRGKRVIGIPKIAGGLAAEVASSSGWYPSRYDYVHGLKGGAISLGINAGVNLIKEFVWKD